MPNMIIKKVKIVFNFNELSVKFEEEFVEIILIKY